MGKIGIKTAGAGMTILIAASAFSDGYRNPPVTAEGNAKANAHRVFVEDASALYYNAANLSRLDRPSYVFSLTAARQEHKISGIGGTAYSDDDWVLLPNVFFAAPLKDSNWSWGIAFTTPHGQGSSFDPAELAAITGPAPVVYDATMMMLDLNPSVAYQLTEQLSIGAGADLYYSELDLKQLIPLGPGISQRLDVESDGTGIGGHLGISWAPAENHHLAFTYVSQFKVDYEGDLKATPSFPPPAYADSSDYSSSITFPDIFGIGYGIELGDRFRLEANVEWLRWSLNKTLIMNAPPNPPAGVPQNWEDTWTFGLGADFKVSDTFILRAGYAFVETPIPDQTLTPILPDMDRHVLSMGMGWKVGNHGLDISYSHSIYDNRNTVGVAANPYQAAFKTQSNLAGLTYSYVF